LGERRASVSGAEKELCSSQESGLNTKETEKAESTVLYSYQNALPRPYECSFCTLKTYELFYFLYISLRLFWGQVYRSNKANFGSERNAVVVQGYKKGTNEDYRILKKGLVRA